jgi:hypothetical protein
MWIVKGSLLGVVLFVVGSILFLYFRLGYGGAHATGVIVLENLTIYNPLFWAASCWRL